MDRPRGACPQGFTRPTVPDFWKGVALQRIAGFLAPNGVLLVRDIVYDFEPALAPARIGEWLAGASEDPTVG